MPFAVAAAAIGAGTAVYTASQNSKAAKSANQRQDAALNQANEMTAPYREAGAAALTTQTNLLGQNGPEAAAAAMQQYQTSPGYEFQLHEGMRAIDSGAAARGMLNSGQTIKAEQKYGQGLADMDFGQYYSRLNQLSTMGQNAAVGSGTNAMNTASQQAQTDVSATGANNSAYGQAAQGIGNAVNQYGNNSAYQQQTNQLMQSNYNSNGGGYFGTSGGSQYGAGGYTGMGPFV